MGMGYIKCFETLNLVDVPCPPYQRGRVQPLAPYVIVLLLQCRNLNASPCVACAPVRTGCVLVGANCASALRQNLSTLGRTNGALCRHVPVAAAGVVVDAFARIVVFALTFVALSLSRRLSVSLPLSLSLSLSLSQLASCFSIYCLSSFIGSLISRCFCPLVFHICLHHYLSFFSSSSSSPPPRFPPFSQAAGLRTIN